MSGIDQGFRIQCHSRGSIAKRRHGIRIDLTPMVDVAFLLLTFFMLTTSLMKHQAMEVNIPPPHAPRIPVAEYQIGRASCRERVYSSV